MCARGFKSVYSISSPPTLQTPLVLHRPKTVSLVVIRPQCRHWRQRMIRFAHRRRVYTSPNGRHPHFGQRIARSLSEFGSVTCVPSEHQTTSPCAASADVPLRPRPSPPSTRLASTPWPQRLRDSPEGDCRDAPGSTSTHRTSPANLLWRQNWYATFGRFAPVRVDQAPIQPHHLGSNPE